jgi:hypothetical protein
MIPSCSIYAGTSISHLPGWRKAGNVQRDEAWIPIPFRGLGGNALVASIFPEAAKESVNMQTTLTAKLKLLPTPEQFTALRQTQLAYRDALNLVSQYAFQHGKTSNR